MSTFNARLSFKGEGELTVTLPVIGQISIWNGRDIYLRGATTEIIETLRQYRSMQLEHTLNGEIRGCYRIIEVGAIDKIPQNAFRPVAAPRTEHIASLKAQMLKANELTHFDEEVLEEAKKEEPKVDNKEEETEKVEETTEETTENIKETTENTDNTDIVDNVNDDITENKENTEEPKAELSTNIEEITVSVGNLKGKKIGELDAKGLRKVLRYSKSEVERKAAETALKIKFPQK